MTADAMVMAADRLAAVLAAENAALKDRAWDSLVPIAEDKREALQAYEQVWQHLSDPAALNTAERNRLRRAGEALAALSEENERRLTMLMFAQRRVMAAISEAVIATRPGVGVYGRTGGLNRGRRSAPPAVSVNRAF